MRLGKMLLIGVLVLTLGLAAAPAAMADKTMTIGAWFAMTGPHAYYGRVMSRGALPAIDLINSAGGVEGIKLKLEIADFKNVQANLAVTGLRKFISIDKIPFALASFSAPTLACQPIAARAHVVVINGGGYSPKLINKPYLHTTRLAQHQMVPPMLKFFWKKGVRKLAVLYMSDPAGEIPYKKYIKPLWEKMGGTIVAAEPHQPGLTDFSTYLARIKAAKPDGLYDISVGMDTAYVVKGAKEIGLNIPMCVPDWSNDYNAVAGKTSEGVFMPGDYFDSKSDNPLTRKFVEAFEKQWKEPTDFYSANYYDAVYYILAELIRRVVKKGGDPFDGAQLEQAIWENPSFDTVYGGKLTLNRDGSADKPMVIFQLQGGKPVVYEKVQMN